MEKSTHPAVVLPPYVAAVLQMVADGYTEEDAATYLGCDVDLVEDALELARRHLSADTLEHAVALAMAAGLIV